MPTPKLIALDLDGTLLRRDKTISPRCIEVIAGAKRKCAVMIASARPPRSVRAFYQQLGLDTLQVNYNGGLVWDEPRLHVAQHNPIPAVVAQRVIRFARDAQPDCVVQCEILDKCYTDRADNRYLTETARLFGTDVIAPITDLARLDVTKVMLLGPREMIDALEELFRGQMAEQIQTARTDPDLLQIMSARAGKLAGVKFVAGQLGIDLADVMAIGDAQNDVDLIRAVGMGVAVENASADALAVADWIAPSNEADGVAVAIERYL
jgi:5-amino-6-(5-phospho-D-ribitylamino)uracil phosphatase